MMASSPASPVSDSGRRRRWTARVAALSLIGLLLLIALLPGLRGLAADTWREMRSISPAALALIFAFKVLQALFSAMVWRNALASAWPRSFPSYWFVLGAEQGQVAINTVVPARAGTWAMLGLFGLAIPGARAPKLLAVWGAQSVAFGLFAGINYAVVAVGLPGRSQDQDGPVERISRVATAQPVLTAAIAAAVILAMGAAAFRSRHRIGQVKAQIREGLAILSPPARYIRLLFIPSLVSYGFSCASYVVLLTAFGIPVTIWTLALALGSNALAGAVRITPGGLGTTQALDVIALRNYAAPDVVTAYSLSELAITAVVSVTISVVALLLATGSQGARGFLLHLRHGEFATGVRALGARQRALRNRALRRRPGGDR